MKPLLGCYRRLGPPTQNPRTGEGLPYGGVEGGQVHRFLNVHELGPRQHCLQPWQEKPPSKQEGDLSCRGGHGVARDDVLLERSS